MLTGEDVDEELDGGATGGTAGPDATTGGGAGGGGDGGTGGAGEGPTPTTDGGGGAGGGGTAPGEGESAAVPGTPTLAPPEGARVEEPTPVGAPDSQERKDYLSARLSEGFWGGVGQGALLGGAVLGATGLASWGMASRFATRPGGLAASKLAGPIGAVAGGLIGAYQLGTKIVNWRETAATLGGITQLGQGLEGTAAGLEAIAEILDIAGAVADIVGGVAGTIALVAWAAALPTVGASTPVAAPSSALAVKAALVGLALSVLKTILQGIAVLLRREHALHLDADEAAVRAAGEKMQQGAEGVGGFVGGAGVGVGVAGVQGLAGRLRGGRTPSADLDAGAHSPPRDLPDPPEAATGRRPPPTAPDAGPAARTSEVDAPAQRPRSPEADTITVPTQKGMPPVEGPARPLDEGAPAAPRELEDPVSTRPSGTPPLDAAARGRRRGWIRQRAQRARASLEQTTARMKATTDRVIGEMVAGTRETEARFVREAEAKGRPDAAARWREWFTQKRSELEALRQRNQARHDERLAARLSEVEARERAELEALDQPPAAPDAPGTSPPDEVAPASGPSTPPEHTSAPPARTTPPRPPAPPATPPPPPPNWAERLVPEGSKRETAKDIFEAGFDAADVAENWRKTWENDVLGSIRNRYDDAARLLAELTASDSAPDRTAPEASGTTGAGGGGGTTGEGTGGDGTGGTGGDATGTDGGIGTEGAIRIPVTPEYAPPPHSSFVLDQRLIEIAQLLDLRGAAGRNQQEAERERDARAADEPVWEQFRQDVIAGREASTATGQEADAARTKNAQAQSAAAQGEADVEKAREEEGKFGPFIGAVRVFRSVAGILQWRVLPDEAHELGDRITAKLDALLGDLTNARAVVGAQATEAPQRRAALEGQQERLAAERERADATAATWSDHEARAAEVLETTRTRKADAAETAAASAGIVEQTRTQEARAAGERATVGADLDAWAAEQVAERERARQAAVAQVEAMTGTPGTLEPAQ